jgi:putative toxin-antitoxin system antitoxin component (TIGR02293 family)
MVDQKKVKEYKIDQELNLFFGEPDVMLYQTTPKKNIKYSEFLDDKMMIISAIRAGIPYSLFEVIQEQAPFTEADWADFLDISTKSLQRYKVAPSHHFKSIHSEKIIEMAEVTKAGLDFFGDIEKLKLWLNTPNYALASLKPIELLKDSYGKELVLTVLSNMGHGIFI